MVLYKIKSDIHECSECRQPGTTIIPLLNYQLVFCENCFKEATELFKRNCFIEPKEDDIQEKYLELKVARISDDFVKMAFDNYVAAWIEFNSPLTLSIPFTWEMQTENSKNIWRTFLEKTLENYKISGNEIEFLDVIKNFLNKKR